MTYAPDKLNELSTYWEDHGGVPLGIVGNVLHKSGYHLGRDRIYGPDGQGDDDYSVQYQRDKAGLTDGASAIDLGRLNGKLGNLYDFSNDLVARLMDNPDMRHDFREVIYSPDGLHVQRYSAIDNAIHTGAGNGDQSHLSHTHISYLRDSEQRDKLAAIRPYFEDVMPIVPVYLGHIKVTKTDGAQLFTGPSVSLGLPTKLALGTVWRKYGTVQGWQMIEVGYGQPPVPSFMWVKSSDIVAEGTPLTVIDGPVPDVDAWEAWYAEAPTVGGTP